LALRPATLKKREKFIPQDKKTDFVTIDRNPGLLNHENTGLESLEEIIGEKVDWSKPEIF